MAVVAVAAVVVVDPVAVSVDFLVCGGVAVGDVDFVAGFCLILELSV